MEKVQEAYDSLTDELTQIKCSNLDGSGVETLAEDMGNVCLKEFGARHVVVTLRKFILPRTDSVSVTVHVSRHR